MLSIFFKLLIFFGLTEPPYKTFGDVSLNLLLINFIILKRSWDFGISPLPIAQTGSYAIKILDLFFIFFKPFFI